METTRERRHRWHAAAWVLAITVSVSACGEEDPSPAGGGGATDPAEVEVVEARDDIEYYNPCANASFEVDGTAWYPLSSMNEDPMDHLEDYPEPSPSPSAGGRGVGALSAVRPMVAPPEPGDDTGEWVEWSDGTARFTSDNGDVSWFTTEKREYGWIC